jgi:TrpR-related protein YerC/YecD
MTNSYPTPDMQDLFAAVTTLKTPTELANFFRDLMTIKELEDISLRWKIAQLLNQQIPYLEIAKECGVSTTTVTRVALWLHHGQNGYLTALSRLHSHAKNA